MKKEIKKTYWMKIVLNKYSQTRKLKTDIDPGEVIYFATDKIVEFKKTLSKIADSETDQLIWLESVKNKNYLFFKKNIYKIETWESRD